MRNLAKGSVLLGLIALIGAFFYFQPTAEAVTIAIDSQKDIKQEFIEKNNFNNQNIQQEDNQPQEITIETENIEENEASKTSEAMTFRATAYCLKGRTANGSGVRRGIVAADRRILPLGTRINLSAGSYSGNYVVADTGGAVKGRILDIWMPSCAEAIRFGRRTVTVRVVGKK
jgi:3D (Asp-Asp-Asp) domain-containing protein